MTRRITLERLNSHDFKVRNKSLTLLVILVITAVQILAQTTDGPNTVGTVSNLSLGGSSTSWTNLANGAASDDSYIDIPNNAISSSGDFTDLLLCGNFGFNIPAGATVVGILVEIERTDVNNTKDNIISIVKGGVVGSDDKSTNQAWSGEAVISYGDNMDIWSETWTADNINSSDFGVVISVKKQGGGANPIPRIDHVQVSVSYNAVLPIQLMHFSAIANNGGTLIKWSTASESDNDFFTIEHSKYGSDWVDIARVDGAGQSSSLKTYNFVHDSPEQGANYYRLKQTDFDGHSAYFKTVYVEYGDAPSPSLILFPNPADQTLQLSRLILQENASLIGSDGSLLPIQWLPNKEGLVITTQDLINGTYYLKIDEAGQQTSFQPFVVSHY